MKVATELGDLAEVLVLYQLSAAGLPTFMPSVSHLPYDLLSDIGEGRFLRVQVKGTAQPRKLRGKVSRSYVFTLKCKDRPYNTDMIDWFAFVALDVERVLFVPAAEVLSQDNLTQYSITMDRLDADHRASKTRLLQSVASGREKAT